MQPLIFFIILLFICIEIKLPRASYKRDSVVTWLDKFKESCDTSPYADFENSHVLCFENTSDFFEYYICDCDYFAVPQSDRAKLTVFSEAVNEKIKAKEFVWQKNKVWNTIYLFII